ncbi:MAG: hypothetical protein ACK4G4_11580, partial [Thermus sp.]
MVNKAKVALVVPYAPAVLLFRKSFLRELRSHGKEAMVFAPDWTTKLRAEVEGATGAKALDYPLKRAGISPLSDLRTLIALTLAFWRL